MNALNNMNMTEAMTCQEIEEHIASVEFNNELTYHSNKKGDNNIFERKGDGYKYMNKKTHQGLKYMTSAGMLRIIMSQQQQLIRLNYMNAQVIAQPVVAQPVAEPPVAEPPVAVVAEAVAEPVAEVVAEPDMHFNQYGLWVAREPVAEVVAQPMLQEFDTDSEEEVDLDVDLSEEEEEEEVEAVAEPLVAEPLVADIQWVGQSWGEMNADLRGWVKFSGQIDFVNGTPLTCPCEGCHFKSKAKVERQAKFKLLKHIQAKHPLQINNNLRPAD